MNRFQKYREAKGYTHEYVAKVIGVSRQAYSRYESGERECSFQTLCKLADIYDTSVDCLLGRVDDAYSFSEQDELHLTKTEKTLIKKYRVLDQRGKESVDDTLKREYGFVAPKDEDEAM